MGGTGWQWDWSVGCVVLCATGEGQEGVYGDKRMSVSVNDEEWIATRGKVRLPLWMAGDRVEEVITFESDDSEIQRWWWL